MTVHVSLTSILFTIIAILIGGLSVFHSFKESHENFYFSVSYKIKNMIVDTKKVVVTKDTQSLIEIMFFSLEEHILYIMKHHKFLRKKYLNENDFARYNNLFYIYLAGIHTEWYVNGIDVRLVSLFMRNNRASIKQHMTDMRTVMLDKTIKPKYRRRMIVNLYIKMLEDIKTDYIEAYDSYIRILDGEISFEELIQRLECSEEELKSIYLNLKDLTEEHIHVEPDKHVYPIDKKKENA